MVVRARAGGARSRYEVISDAIRDLQRAESDLRAIDLRTCPPDLRDGHKRARELVAMAIQEASALGDTELDSLSVPNGRL